jgi:hypothetical protein
VLLEEGGRESYRREAEAFAAAGSKGPLPPAYYLAISGGDENGTFGAGLLIGWKTGRAPSCVASAVLSLPTLSAEGLRRNLLLRCAAGCPHDACKAVFLHHAVV